MSPLSPSETQPLGVSRAREPSAWTVRTSPSLPPEKFISSARAVIVPEAISLGCRAVSNNAQSEAISRQSTVHTVSILPLSSTTKIDVSELLRTLIAGAVWLPARSTLNQSILAESASQYIAAPQLPEVCHCAVHHNP